MREILFRAKSVDYGEWKVGGIYQEPKNDIKDYNSQNQMLQLGYKPLYGGQS